jgi:Concanavalin A-like lectin/glucanases superfamily
MNPEYTKYLLVIFVLLVLSAGIILIQNMAVKESALQELFDTQYDPTLLSNRKAFADHNIRNAVTGNAAMDIGDTPTPLPSPELVKRAVEDIDLFAQRQRPPTESWYTNLASSPLLEMERNCRKTKKPEDLVDDTAKQSPGCTWMYNASGTSGATLATPDQPIFSFSRKDFPTSTYELTWSKNAAIKKEAIKKCNTVTKCDLVIPGSGCGFCPEWGVSVPVNADGTARYSDWACPNVPISDPTKCYLPRDQGGAGLTAPTCQPDAQGRLSRTCLISLATQASCTDSGTILQSLKNTSSPELSSQQVKDVANIMSMYNFSIPSGILTDGSVTVDTALNTYAGIQQEAQNGNFWSFSFDNGQFRVIPPTGGRKAKAARNLCYGNTFQSCDYDDTSVENFTLECLQNLYNANGCQGNGDDFPTQSNINRFNGRSWGDIKQEVIALTDTMTNSQQKYTADQQKEAVRRCIGIHLRRRTIGYCNELGISVRMYYGDPANSNSVFLGRKIITNQFFILRNDSTMWDFLKIGQLQLVQTNAPTDTITLVIETNFNPDTNKTLVLTRVGNAVDTITWNGTTQLATNTNNMGIVQNTMTGFALTKDNQQSQSFVAKISLFKSMYQSKQSIWYITDAEGNSPSINICRLPRERRNPLINVTMNQNAISEITNTITLKNLGVVVGNRGGKACGVFKNNANLQILNPLRTKAFRSYSCKIYCESLGNHPRLWQFYNGSVKESGYYWNWWPPYWRNDRNFTTEDWWYSQDNIQMALGNNDTSIIPCFKQNSQQNHSIVTSVPNVIKVNAWQHFAWVWNNDFSGFDIFVDGVKTASATGPAINDTTTNQNFIGKAFNDGWHGFFQGGMEWFRAFDYPLTPDDIQQDMDDDW